MAGWTLTLWCLAATVVLINLARRLPFQNLLATAAIVAIIGAGLALNSERLFAFSVPTMSSAESLSQPRPSWSFLPFWIAIVLSCRAVARLVVQARLPRENTGLWTLGLASILISVWAMSAQHFATSHALAVGTTGASLPDGPVRQVGLHLFGWMIAALITLVAIAPWLINKSPGEEPRDWPSLTIWLLVGLFFVFGFVRQHMWLNAGVSLILMAIITASAGRDTRRSNRESRS